LFRFRPPVELIHRSANTLRQHRLDRNLHAIEHLIQHRKLLLAHRRQQIIPASRLNLSSVIERRLPYPDTNPNPLFRPKRAGDRLHSVVPVRRTTLSYPKLSQRKRQLVVENDDVFRDVLDFQLRRSASRQRFLPYRATKQMQTGSPDESGLPLTYFFFASAAGAAASASVLPFFATSGSVAATSVASAGASSLMIVTCATV